MLQSEYDIEQRHKRLKILLIILTAIAVALVLYAVIKVGREYLYKPAENIMESANRHEVRIPDRDIIVKEYHEFRGEEAEEFLKGDSPEAQYLRSVQDLKL